MPGYPLFLIAHASVGAVALASFWSAAVLRKGSPRHRLAGNLFLLAMCAILLTGMPLALQRFFEGKPMLGAFFAYLLLITGQACWLAWRAVTDKRDWRAMVTRVGWRFWSLAPLLAGCAMLTLGIMQGAALSIGFGLIGILVAANMWRFARRGPNRPNWWLVQHYRGMLGAGVAAHVAFLTIAMQPFWTWLRVYTAIPDALVSLFPWFAPIVVAVAAGVWLNRKYQPDARTATQLARASKSAN